MIRNIGDIPCGGLPDINEISAFFNLTMPIRRGYYGRAMHQTRPENLTDNQNIIYDIHRLISHIENHEFRWEFRNIENPDVNEHNLRELRINYLMNNISEDSWKKSLQQIEKKTFKSRDIYNILRMFTITSSDILRQLVLDDISVDDCINQVSELKKYVNNQFSIVRTRYGGIVNPIRDNWGYNYRNI